MVEEVKVMKDLEVRWGGDGSGGGDGGSCVGNGCSILVMVVAAS